MAALKVEHTVTEADTAALLGSGDLPVLATPRLVNWLERAAYAAAKEVIDPGLTTVGTLVRIEHLKGSLIGTELTLSCSKAISDGRRLIFHVSVVDDVGDEVATGEMHRRVVDPERFMGRLTLTPEP